MKIKDKRYSHQLGKIVSVLLFLMFFVVTSISAQAIQVNLNVNSRPTAYVAEWYRPQNGLVSIVVRKTEKGQSFGVRFETELLDSDGELIYSLPYLQSDLMQVTGTVATFPLSSIIQLHNGNFVSPKLTHSFSSGGKLSSGQYTIRVRVWHEMEDFPMTEWTPSKVFLINSYQLPQLMLPADGADLDIRQANSVITFRWTPLTPSMSQSVATYRLQIWQVLPGHTPIQSMLSTPPLEDRYIRGTTQFIWQPRLGMIDGDFSSTNQFIWTIQTLDERELPVETTDSSIDGRSEPAVFTVSAIMHNGVDSTAVAENEED